MPHSLILQENNKLEIMQTLILHSAVTIHKAALDPFIKGISILSLLREIEKNPQKFEQFFVHLDEIISPEFVKKLLKVPDSSDLAHSGVFDMLVEFIDTATKEELVDFLSFTTGSKSCLGGLRSDCIKVSVDSTQGFFASTCSFEVVMPACIPDTTEFQLLLKSVIKGTRFTTV